MPKKGSVETGSRPKQAKTVATPSRKAGSTVKGTEGIIPLTDAAEPTPGGEARGRSRRRTARRRQVDEATRQAAAVRLRAAGFSYDQIAAELGWASRSSAYESVRRALREHVSEAVTELRILEGARLDELQAAHYQAAKVDLRSAQLVLGIMAQRAKLFGLDRLPPIQDERDHDVDELLAVIGDLIRPAKSDDASN